MAKPGGHTARRNILRLLLIAYLEKLRLAKLENLPDGVFLERSKKFGYEAHKPYFSCEIGRTEGY